MASSISIRLDHIKSELIPGDKFQISGSEVVKTPSRALAQKVDSEEILKMKLLLAIWMVAAILFGQGLLYGSSSQGFLSSCISSQFPDEKAF